MNTSPILSVFVIVLSVALWGAFVVLGIKAAKAKGRSPHWMWFGLHPLGAVIAFLVLRFGVSPAGEAAGLGPGLGGKVVCPECLAVFAGKPRKAFFGVGFPTYSCPNCKKDVLYPLTTGLRVTYWIIAVVVILGCVAMFLAQGRVAIPGLLTIVAVIALVRDGLIRKKVAAAAARVKGEAGGAGAAPAQTPPPLT